MIHDRNNSLPTTKSKKKRKAKGDAQLWSSYKLAAYGMLPTPRKVLRREKEKKCNEKELGRVQS